MQVDADDGTEGGAVVRFNLEVDFEMESTPKTRGMLMELAHVLVGDRGGEVTFTRWSMKRIAENGRDVLSEVGAWECKK